MKWLEAIKSLFRKIEAQSSYDSGYSFAKKSLEESSQPYDTAYHLNALASGGFNDHKAHLEDFNRGVRDAIKDSGLFKSNDWW